MGPGGPRYLRAVRIGHQPHDDHRDRANYERHKCENRLLWDIYKIPHHCFYLSIGPEKGEDKTVEEVAWLCETQCRTTAW